VQAPALGECKAALDLSLPRARVRPPAEWGGRATGGRNSSAGLFPRFPTANAVHARCTRTAKRGSVAARTHARTRAHTRARCSSVPTVSRFFVWLTSSTPSLDADRHARAPVKGACSRAGQAGQAGRAAHAGGSQPGARPRRRCTTLVHAAARRTPAGAVAARPLGAPARPSAGGAGSPAARPPARLGPHAAMQQRPPAGFAGYAPPPPPASLYYSIDVECVATGADHNARDVGQISLVDQYENVILNLYVRPDRPVVSYLSALTSLSRQIIDAHGMSLAQACAVLKVRPRASPSRPFQGRQKERRRRRPSNALPIAPAPTAVAAAAATPAAARHPGGRQHPQGRGVAGAARGRRLPVDGARHGQRTLFALPACSACCRCRLPAAG